MIKLRLDLESTLQAGHFGIWFILIGQIEADINQFNILELEHVYCSGCSQFEQVGTGLKVAEFPKLALLHGILLSLLI